MSHVFERRKGGCLVFDFNCSRGQFFAFGGQLIFDTSLNATKIRYLQTRMDSWCWFSTLIGKNIHTSFAIARYLMSNAGGRPNGAEKALRHRELCQFYVAAVHGVADPELVHREHDAIYQAVHTATQELTDYLDEVIGFPVEERPEYDKLEPLFFEHFHRLAMTALASNAK